MKISKTRNLAARTGFISGFIFILLALFVIPGATTNIDSSVTQWTVAHRVAFLTPIAQGFTAVGGTVVVLVLAVISLGYLVWKRKILEAEVLFGALAGDVIIVTAIKKLVQRQRPAEKLWIGHVEDQQSFPSGHSANNTVLWLTVALIITVIASTEAEKRIARVLGVLCWVMPLCIGWSRIYVAQHWMSDVLGGWTLGLAWVSFVAWVYLTELEKRSKARENATVRTVSSKS